MDDLQAMYKLKDGRLKGEANKEIELEVAETLIAKQFYFELEKVPIYRGGEYTCRGSIFCRLTGEPRAALLTYLYQISASIHLADTVLIGGLKPPVQLNSRSICNPVEFSLKSRTEELSIAICGINRKARVISGFPTSVSQLVKNQGLDSVFGTRNHVKRVRTSHDISRKRRRTAS